jgi:hypothetical protein
MKLGDITREALKVAKHFGGKDPQSTIRAQVILAANWGQGFKRVSPGVYTCARRDRAPVARRSTPGSGGFERTWAENESGAERPRSRHETPATRRFWLNQAAGVGFEPTGDLSAASGFQDRPVRPLRHPAEPHCRGGGLCSPPRPSGKGSRGSTEN